MDKQSFKIIVKGVVQGIGFRPFIYKLAKNYNFNGFVKNTKNGVEILISDASINQLQLFCRDIKDLSPPGAIIRDIEYKQCENTNYSEFKIIKSEHSEGLTAIPPDLSICSDCIKDISEPDNKRYRYPFTNCTNCGPRYSIIKNIPYDRSKTTMAEFQMCESCLIEYEDVLDRRYHAQPVCCHVCGPQIMFNGQTGENAFKAAAAIINEGGFLNLKGLGGYQIICNAADDKAVKKLRKLKNRKNKPLALMVRDADTLRKHISIDSQKTIKILDTPSAPIVIENWGKLPVSAYINPTGEKIGIMKAYTPLHHILFSYLKTDFIVATSGNLVDEPICINEQEAYDKLSHFSKDFLIHNRPIHTRVDDSVITTAGNKEYMLRRARGYAPLPVILPEKTCLCIAGMGAHLKSSITLAKNDYAFTSQYIGDLDNSKTTDFYQEVYEKMKRLFGLKPEILLTDLHPDYFSSKFAQKICTEKIVTIQHHHAHLYSCMAEYGITDNVIGVIFDGTGLGSDGSIWGGEFFLLQKSLSRQFHLKNYLQPGLDSAAKHPVRMLTGYLHQMNLLNEHIDKITPLIRQNEINLIKKMTDRKLNSIPTSSAGRLFEAAGTLLTGETVNEYEGFTAILLENIIEDEQTSEYYPWDLKKDEIDFKNFFEGILHDFDKGLHPGVISKKFHNSVAMMITDICNKIRQQSGCTSVVLSGGVFQNIYLLEKSEKLLQKYGFNVYIHKNIPPNDGGISLGQVYKYILDNR
ncbi:(NiFe) hydrogenase maturation protein HypF [Flexistipes sinusarabici DSM 4947]|uniref:Carbamoyltransferase n=1 Tax=Flexistipes sinusarabici (strain ATCC 49648 / DSM 4947 / MAS 10) TaxID=717231 RepID=F8E7S9_FLESM|nr:carbamoyltransferase HypF [Flexistipes sinusarabici]AEI13924.1 (NiFe) hydrogenase maturation protein HypF [Flexistipes sinusarabici DSM 4947]